MKKIMYVKTYDLVTGEIKIGNVQKIIDEDKIISCWKGPDEFKYENEENTIKIEGNTLIWDKFNRRFVFAYEKDFSKGFACFSTVVIECSEFLENLLTNNEKVQFCWN